MLYIVDPYGGVLRAMAVRLRFKSSAITATVLTPSLSTEYDAIFGSHLHYLTHFYAPEPFEMHKPLYTVP